MSYIIYLIQAILAFLFVATAFDKMKNWQNHHFSISQYKLLPKRLIKYFLLIIIGLELMIAFLFYFFSVNIYSIGLITVTLLIYTSAVVINLIRGNTAINCGCGSLLENKELNYGIVVRNFFIILLSFIPFLYQSPITISFFSRLFFSLCAVNILILIAILKEVRVFIVNSKKIFKVVE